MSKRGGAVNKLVPDRHPAPSACTSAFFCSRGKRFAPGRPLTHSRADRELGHFPGGHPDVRAGARAGLVEPDRAASELGIFSKRTIDFDIAASQAIAAAGRLVQREAYVLAYIDGFWIIAWVLAAAPLLVLLLRRPPPNPMTAPRIDR